MTETQFKDCFRYLTGHEPFHWQIQLFESMKEGHIPAFCDIPTGLGKTSVIALWILALGRHFLEACGTRKIPLRLIYVVDRRVVVDQSTDEAERVIHKLQDSLCGPESPSILTAIAQGYERATFTRSGALIALSSLRGQRADNREWCLDPSRPAIVVGTVDMIGSRLLFSGYGGVGKNHRSLQAGLLGQDTLIVIDEAHLASSFVRTMIQIKESVHRYHLLRPFEVMLLSATIPSGDDQMKHHHSKLFPFDPTVETEEAKKRLYAEKELRWLSIAIPDSAKSKEIRELTAREIGELAISYEKESCSVIIFVSTVDLVNEVASTLAAKLGKESESRILKMTGEMRGDERDTLAEGEKFKRFLPSRDRETQRATHYLIATSCAEVGANLDANHGICDLSSLDSMIQRLGRINRFGSKKAIISVVINERAIKATQSDIARSEQYENDLKLATEAISQTDQNLASIKRQLKNAKKDEALKKARRETEEKLKEFKKREKALKDRGGKFDESYKSAQRLSGVEYYTWQTLNRLGKSGDGLDAAPAALRDLPKDPRAYHTLPVVPALDNARLDDWAMTSLKQAEYPRPLVGYWLRGVTEDDTLQTVFCWRADLNYAGTCGQAEVMAQIIPVAPQEKATLATFRAVEMLKILAKASPEKIVVFIDSGGDYSAQKLKDLSTDNKELFALAAYATVIIPSQCGGLDDDGNPSAKLTKTNHPVPDVVNEDEWRRYAIKPINAGEYECGQLNSVSGTIDNLRSFSSLTETLAFYAAESKGICLNARELRRSFADMIEDKSSENSSGERLQFAYFLNRSSSEHYLREDDDIASLGFEGEHGRTVTEHDGDVERYARELADKIGLSPELVSALGIAGKKHDEGKNRAWWQAAIGNANDGSPTWQPLAKSTHNSFDHNLNQGYRHEFGSLIEASADELLKAHPHRDLILHVIAAHHGYARPHFPTRAFDRNLPRALAQKLMEEAMQRFLRLQRQYGWWQLAYLEAIVKAADALASRDFSRGAL